jgi:hypothetical protein
MTMTELAPKTSESTTKSTAPHWFAGTKKTLARFKKPLAGVGVATIAVALCGFTYAGISNAETVKTNETLKTDVLTIASQLDDWAGKQTSSDATISINSHGNSVNPAFNGIKSDPTLQDVVWTAYGTADSYCIKAYSKAGGTHNAYNAMTYDSKGEGLGSQEGACKTKSGVANVDGSEPVDNTDIR